jgi:hypothetical protein
MQDTFGFCRCTVAQHGQQFAQAGVAGTTGLLMQSTIDVGRAKPTPLSRAVGYATRLAEPETTDCSPSRSSSVT